MRQPNKTRWIARGGVSAIMDLVGGLGMWGLLLFGLMNLVQIGRVWEVAQHATYDAAEGVAAYGCWTPQVTQVVQSDLNQVALAGAPTIAMTNSAGLPIASQAYFVSAQSDPALTVTMKLPIYLGGWMGINLWKVDLSGTATITSSAIRGMNLATGGSTCVEPQV